MLILPTLLPSQHFIHNQPKTPNILFKLLKNFIYIIILSYIILSFLPDLYEVKFSKMASLLAYFGVNEIDLELEIN